MFRYTLDSKKLLNLKQKGRNNKMQIIKIDGYTVQIFKSYNGTQVFISDSKGVQIYAHKVSGEPMLRAMEVINNQ